MILVIFPSNGWFSARGGGEGRSPRAVLLPPSKSHWDLSFQGLPVSLECGGGGVCVGGEWRPGRVGGWRRSIFCSLVGLQLQLETRDSVFLRSCSICYANSHSSQQSQFRKRSDFQTPFSQTSKPPLQTWLSIGSFASYFSEKIEAIEREQLSHPSSSLSPPTRTWAPGLCLLSWLWVLGCVCERERERERERKRGGRTRMNRGKRQQT